MIERLPDMSLCRICQSHYKPFLSFGRMPLANAFLSKSDFSKEFFFDLAVGFCAHCGVVQLMKQPAPQKMFHNRYPFFTGSSRHMTEHFQRFAEDVRRNHLPEKDSFVIEIGANDGTLLENFVKTKIRCLGIEPSRNTARIAKNRGLNILPAFFSEKLALQIVKKHGRADAIVAANVICHISDIHSVARGVAALLKPGGVFIFEEPYLGDVLRKTSYDQIYDEHVFLFSATAVQNLFRPYGLELFDAKPQKTHGGSMRYFVGRKGARSNSRACARILKREKALGFNHPETYRKFKNQVIASRSKLVRLLQSLKRGGKRVMGYAATSKSTTVLNYCGIGPKLLPAICDTTPLKQGKFSPGMHIPIVPYETFQRNPPDYALLLAWNHQKEIMAKEKAFTRRGGKWIVFVPKVKIL